MSGEGEDFKGIPNRPGKYAHLVEWVVDQAKARGVILIVVDGYLGTSIDAMAPYILTLQIPQLLRNAAADLEGKGGMLGFVKPTGDDEGRGNVFTEDEIRRRNLPKDVFGLLHDLCYHHDNRDVWSYVRRAQNILKLEKPDETVHL